MIWYTDIMKGELIVKRKCSLTNVTQASAEPVLINQTAEHKKMGENYDRIVEFGWNIRNQFEQLRIKNAIYIDCIDLESPPQWLLRSDQTIKQILSTQLHIHSQLISCRSIKSILVYNRHTPTYSMIPACRLALILLHFNVCEYVDILVDGLEEYFNVASQKMNVIRLSRNTTSQLQQEHKIIVSLEDINNVSQCTQLVDVRTRAEFDGLTSGYAYHGIRGHITGSIYHGGQQSHGVNQAKQYALDGKFIKMWQQNSICINKPMVLYCGTGWRASMAMVLAILHGVQVISLYSNGWVEWSSAKIGQKVVNKQILVTMVSSCSKVIQMDSY